jgi:pilus assembly protein FimV
MAKEIIPESALFGGTEKAMTPKAAPVTTETSAPDPFTSADQDMNFSSASLNDDLIDLNAPTLPDMALMDEINSELAELQLNLPEASDDNGLDFDLSSFSKPDPKAAANVESAPTDIESIDFDLSGLDIKPEADTKQLASEDTLESFDFNFELNSPKLEPETDSQTLDIASLESFEFPEFGDSADIEEKSIPQPVAPAPENALSLDTSDEFDFNFDFEAPSSSKSKSSDDDIDFGVSDLTDMDEFETKIDLAKAYIDMGDADAAKSIAQEVLEKGTPEQKQAAQALLDELK